MVILTLEIKLVRSGQQCRIGLRKMHAFTCFWPNIDRLLHPGAAVDRNLARFAALFKLTRGMDERIRRLQWIPYHGPVLESRTYSAVDRGEVVQTTIGARIGMVPDGKTTVYMVPFAYDGMFRGKLVLPTPVGFPQIPQ